MSSFVQSTFATTSATGTTEAAAYGSNNASGNILIAFAGPTNNTTDDVTITDSHGNTWSRAFTTANNIAAWYVNGCGAGANTVTATFGTSTVARFLQIGEWVGPASALLDVATTAAPSGCPGLPITFTTTNIGDLVVAYGLVVNNFNTCSFSGTGVTNRDTNTYQSIAGASVLADTFTLGSGSQTLNLQGTRPCGCNPSSADLAVVAFKSPVTAGDVWKRPADGLLYLRR